MAAGPTTRVRVRPAAPDDDGRPVLAPASSAPTWASALRPSPPPEPLDAAIIDAPGRRRSSWPALRATGQGGTVVCAGIHMSDIPAFPCSELLGANARIRSVANLTRADGEALLELAPKVPVETHVTTSIRRRQETNDRRWRTYEPGGSQGTRRKSTVTFLTPLPGARWAVKESNLQP